MKLAYLDPTDKTQLQIPLRTDKENFFENLSICYDDKGWYFTEGSEGGDLYDNGDTYEIVTNGIARNYFFRVINLSELFPGCEDKFRCPQVSRYCY